MDRQTRAIVESLKPHYAAAIGGILGGWQKDSNELNALGANATNQQNTQAKQKSEAAKFTPLADKLEGQQNADAKGLNSGVQAPIPMGKRLGDIMGSTGGTDNSSIGMAAAQGNGTSDAFGARTATPPTSYSGGLKDAVHADAQLSNIRTTDSTQPNTSGPEAMSAGQGAMQAGAGDSTTATAGTGGDNTNALIGAAGGALSSAIQAGGQGAAGGQIPQAGGQGGQYQPTANMSMQQLMQAQAAQKQQRGY